MIRYSLICAFACVAFGLLLLITKQTTWVTDMAQYFFLGALFLCIAGIHRRLQLHHLWVYRDRTPMWNSSLRAPITEEKPQ